MCKWLTVANEKFFMEIGYLKPLKGNVCYCNRRTWSVFGKYMSNRTGLSPEKGMPGSKVLMG